MTIKIESRETRVVLALLHSHEQVEAIPDYFPFYVFKPFLWAGSINLNRAPGNI